MQCLLQLLNVVLTVAVGLRTCSCQMGLEFLGHQPFTAYVSRATPPGKVIYTIVAVNTADNRLSSNISYSLNEESNDKNLFEIDAQTGHLVILQYLPLQSLVLKIQADQGSESTIADLSVIVLPEYNVVPVFEKNAYNFSLSEYAPINSLFGIVHAFSLDPESSDHSYSIISGNTGNDLAINTTTGVLNVARELDYEISSTYHLIVQYSDGGTQVSTSVKVLVIDENDNIPQFSEIAYKVVLTESHPVSSHAVTISATDRDSAENAMIDYAIVEEDVGFEIDSATGKIFTTTVLDFEEESEHRFTVVTRDHGQPSRTSTVVVIVSVINEEDECPVFESTYYSVILSPDLIATGMEVVTVHATDPDNGTSITYSLETDNLSRVLTLDPHNGTISLIATTPNIYTLVISASDAACAEGPSAEVTINIHSNNNHSPYFVNPCKAQILENSEEFMVATLTAIDDDDGLYGEITYSFTEEGSQFTLNSLTGVVSLSNGAGLDYEEQHFYLLGVTATDRGSRQAYCPLNISVLDVNDNPPKFLTSAYEVRVSESASPGTFLVQTLAEDADDGSNRVIEYMLSDSFSGAFSIDSATGVITTASDLTQQEYMLTVCAVNVEPYVSSEISTPATVTILLHVISDTQLPAFSQSQYNATFCENLPSSTSVLQVFPITNTSNIIYNLISGSEYYTNSDNVFEIDIFGTIRVASQVLIDFERLPESKFQFSVKGEDLGGNTLGISTVEINVLDSDDNGPSFPLDDVFTSIPENSPEGTPFTQLVANDPDSGTNSDISYSLLVGDENFAISENGELTTRVEFDAEKPEFKEMQIVRVLASNPNPINPDDPCITEHSQRQSATVLVRVTIIDVNDNPPSFIDPPDSLNLLENTQLGTVIYNFAGTDPDMGGNLDQLRYTIINGNTYHNFVMNGTGSLILIQPLDYEENPVLTLIVQLSDGTYCTTTMLTIHVINVDDEPPEFHQTAYFTSITENPPLATSILQVSASDIDTGNVSYWLTGTAVGRFVIDTSGVITVVETIDREEFQDGIISFLAVTEGGTIATTLINITVFDVNDCVPRFPNISTMTIQENLLPPVMGGRVLAEDFDSGKNGEILYTLLSGADTGFTINSETGEITAHDIYNREMMPFYTLVVEATDMGANIQLSSTTTFQVKIGDENDNAPFFQYSYAYKRIFENAIIGTEVIQLPAIDLDEGVNAILNYTMLSSVPDIGSRVFALDTTTGVVTLAATLDYEIPLQRSFILTFSVTDSVHEGQSETTIEIELLDQNDHSPVLSVIPTEHDLVIAESALVGTIVLEVTANDEDSGTNAEITFSILSGDPDNDFVITASGNHAAVSIACQLDYETKPSYDLIIQACDKGTPTQCTSSTGNTITIENIDDVVPSFSQPLYEGSIVENEPPSSSILQVNATDPDFGNSFIFNIESGNSGGKFSIDSNTGILSSTMALDREEQEIYTLVIIAADEGGTPLSGTGTAVITVLDTDDNPPANESQWQVHMLLPNGHLQQDHIVDFYFADPDLISTFSNCSTISTEKDGNLFLVNNATCMLLLKQGNPSEDSYAITVAESNKNIISRVDIAVKHILLSDIPIDYLVTISLAMSTVSYLENAHTSFPNHLATLLEVEIQMLTIISVQNGYHNPSNTVDVSFFVEIGGKAYLDPVFILQLLYTQRNILESLGYGLSALPTDPCSSEPCISQASCKSLKTIAESSVMAYSPSLILVSPRVDLGYECVCIPGTFGENCSINMDDCYSNPCQYGAECVDEVNGFRCVCPPGTSGIDCSVSPNGCSSDPCQNGAICKNIPGSHECLCLPGYYGSECQYHYFRTARTCDSSPCQNGGTCSPGRDSFTCLCSNIHSGQFCELDIAPQGCNGNPCYNGSTCIESPTPTGPVCLCSVGFTGPFCRWPIDNCELDPCHNGGTCVTGLYGAYQCYCPPPYTGQTCEDFILGCDSNPCLNGGRCSDTTTGDYTCECTRGYSGKNCEYAVQPVNLCSDTPCHFGNCTYGLDSYTCSCPSSHSGMHCENESPSSTPCNSNPCQHGSECIEVDGDHICSCSPGFTGIHCETNIDECNSNPCVHGMCKDGVAGYECECIIKEITGYNCDVFCPNGQAGDFCEVKTLQCQVDQNPCHNGGSCLEEHGGYSCLCPPTHTGPVCEIENTCDAVKCFNGGTCSSLEDGGYGCTCSEGFDGIECQLLTISFSSTNSYRAYPSLHLSAKGKIDFQFNTVDLDGLLLYNTQLQAGESRDYIAVEVVGGQLVVGVSYGDDTASLVPVAGSVSDGQWHHVTIEITEKSISVTLDFCHELDDVTGTSAGCYLTTNTPGESSFLDLGLPLWLGGAPSSSSSHVQSSRGITACMKEIYINDDLLDLNSHLDQQDSQPGCPELDDQCASGECGAGDCVATWSTTLCSCPPLLSGDLCDIESPSMSYTGSGYAHYTLTEEGARQRRQTGGELRSTYEDSVSLNLHTTYDNGHLFSMYDKAASEYLYIALESGQIVLHLNLGSEQETVVTVAGQELNDSQRHSVTVKRTGLQLTISADSNTLQYSLPLGTPLTLETYSSEIYTGGSPHTTSRFIGCLQDVRINQFTLPTLDSNKFASVVYEGLGDEDAGVMEGCLLSPCYGNPCGSDGTCEERDNSSYECVCSNGERLSTVCPQSKKEVQYLPYIIGPSILLLLVTVSSIITIACVRLLRRRRKKRTYLIGVSDKMGSQELAELFIPSQAIIISNEQGGGEEDTNHVAWEPLALKCGSSSGKPSPPTSSQVGSSKDSPESRATQSSRGSTIEKRQVYRFRLPASEKEAVDGVQERVTDEEVRSNSPVIRAYLEDRVNTANNDIHSVDSLRKFNEEGSEDSEVDSLSSVLNSEDEEEEYTLERLHAAGPPLSSLAPLLEHVLQSTVDFSTRVSPSASDIMLSSYISQ